MRIQECWPYIAWNTRSDALPAPLHVCEVVVRMLYRTCLMPCMKRSGAGRKNLRKSVRKDQCCFAARRGYPFSGTPLPPAKTPPTAGSSTMPRAIGHINVPCVNKESVSCASSNRASNGGWTGFIPSLPVAHKQPGRDMMRFIQHVVSTSLKREI